MQKTEDRGIDNEALLSFAIRVLAPGLATCVLANTILTRFQGIERTTEDAIKEGGRLNKDTSAAGAAFAFRLGVQLRDVGEKLITLAENAADRADLDETFEGDPKEVIRRLLEDSKSGQALGIAIPALAARTENAVDFILGDD